MTTHDSNPPIRPATLVPRPPPVTVPKPPAGFDPANMPSFASSFPKSEELAALAAAVAELAAFADYTSELGRMAPPQAQVVEVLEAAGEWSSMLAASRLWALYVLYGTGSTWQSAHVLMNRLKRPFQLAVDADPTLASKFPATTRLLGAARAVAQKANATKAANKKARANGEPEVHGKKRRRLAAAKAIVEAAMADGALKPAK
jgi:hypothetical protein